MVRKERPGMANTRLEGRPPVRSRTLRRRMVVHEVGWAVKELLK